MVLRRLALISLFLLPTGCIAQGTKEATSRQAFDLGHLKKIQSDTTPPAERIAAGVGFLKQELVKPSRMRWGIGGGPIDSAYVLQAITGSLAFPGAEAPSVLRQYRDRERNIRVKELLTIALAETGAQDTIPDLIRLIAKEQEGAIRYQAVLALSQFLRAPAETDVPKRLRPGEVWKPLEEQTKQAITEVLFSSLQDAFKRYYGPHDKPGEAYYPVIEHTYRTLQKMGYKIQPAMQADRIVGWQVQSGEGQVVRLVQLKEPIRVRSK